jgi:c-di-GMP phosphodiesterase
MPASTVQNSGLWIARKALYDTRLVTSAYELDYQYYPASPQPELDEITAVQILLNGFDVVSLKRLMGEKQIFLRAPRSLLISIPSMALPPEKVILVVAPALADEEALFQRITALVKYGYTLAVGPVTELSAQTTRLSKLAQYIMVPLRRLDPLHMIEIVQQLRMYKTRLIATGIDSNEDLSVVQRLRFDFFQGGFLLQPRRMITHRLDNSRVTVMRMLAKIQDPGADFRALGTMIAQDPKLSQKLLGIVNSPTYSLPRPVDSLDQAVAYIGLKQLRGMLTLLTMASIPGKPPELTTIAMQRARACELLAPVMAQPKADIFFVVGLFSTLDALLDAPMNEAVAGLPLAPEVLAALLQNQGPAAAALAVSRAVERSDWMNLAKWVIKPDVLAPLYLQALNWSAEVAASINQSD